MTDPAPPQRGGDAGGLALRTAIERSGLSISAVARAAGIDRSTLQTWMLGQHLPFRDGVERVAAAVDAPELVDQVVSRPRAVTILMTCRVCQRTSTVTPAQARGRQKASVRGLFVVNMEARTGEHTCHPCWAKGEGAARFARRRAMIYKKRSRKDANQQIGKAMLDWQAEHPDEWKVANARGRATMIANRIGSTSRDLHRARISLAGWSLAPDLGNGRFGLCQLCRKLTYATGQQIKAGRVFAGKFHNACVIEWRRARGRPRSGPRFPPLKGSAGRGQSHADLLLAYQRTVMLYRQRGGGRQALRAADGSVLTVEQLVEQQQETLLCDTTGLYRSARRFLALLPSEQHAAGLVRSLRWALLIIDQAAPTPAGEKRTPSHPSG